MSKESEVNEFNLESRNNAEKIAHERFKNLISTCEHFGDVLTIKPKRSKKQKKILEYLGYYHIYSSCEYEQKEVYEEKSYVNPGYSGTIDENGNVNISSTHDTVYKDEIRTSKPGLYSEEQYIKVCKKGTGKSTQEKEQKISAQKIETLLQIDGGSAIDGKLSFFSSMIFNLMIFLSAISTLIYYMISSCGEFFDYFIFNLIFSMFEKNLNDTIGYSPIRFIFAITAILFSLLAAFIWKHKIKKFKNTENQFSNLIDKYISCAHICSMLITVLTVPFDLLNIWVCSIEDAGFFIQLLMLLLVLVAIIRIIFALIAMANFVISLFFLLGNITYWRLNNSLKQRKHMLDAGEFAMLTRTLKEIQKNTENSILETYLTKDIYKI